LYDHQQRMIYLGNKVNTAAEQYFLNKKKRVLVSELLRIVETENSKRKKKTAKEARDGKAKKTKVEQEVQHEVAQIREKKNVEKTKAVKQAAKQPRPAFRVGDRVRLTDGKAVGSIDNIEKNKAVVNYGQFTTNVSMEQLELVEKGKN
jgi:DNA mismatch repair protein MutS2